MFNEFSRYEQAFSDWCRDGYPGTSTDTFRYIDFLTAPEDDQAVRDGTLWPHQWEAFLRVVYCYEILGKKEIGLNGLLLNIVTGGGKTAIIAAVMAWLRVAHSVEKFLLLCPNLIVKDRLQDDFEGGKVFRDRDLLPSWSAVRADDFELTTLGAGQAATWANLLSASVILGNIHQFYQSNLAGQTNLAGLMNGPDFAVFNDEAHNSPADEYYATLKRIREKTVLRIDTTATPDRADGRNPDSDMIYEYGVPDALADTIIKTPVVYQPDIRTVQLTYTDAKTGEQKRVEEIDWDEVERLGLSATQWVTDDEPMRQQMSIALKRLQEQEARANGKYQPILFVIAVCKLDAEKAANTLNRFFKIKALLVTEDSGEEERRKASELGRQQRTQQPYKAVVSVLMLREGWDVPEVGVILLLRKFSSRVYGQQVIGRGLRRVRRKGIDPAEPQICSVVDHPKLEHQWLWEIFGSRVRQNVGIDEEFDETADLPEPPPKQELVFPDRIVQVPPPIENFLDGEDFSVNGLQPPAEPVAGWAEVLAAMDYDTTAVEITRVDIDAVRGRELAGDGWTTIQGVDRLVVDSGPDSIAPSDEMLRGAIKEQVLLYASELTERAGYASGFKSEVYSALMRHIREKFLGASLGLADRNGLEFAWKMLPQVRQRVLETPGLVAGIIEYANQ